MYCPNCGSQNRDDARFCTSCGTNFAQAAEQPSGESGVGGTQLFPPGYFPGQQAPQQPQGGAPGYGTGVPSGQGYPGPSGGGPGIQGTQPGTPPSGQGYPGDYGGAPQGTQGYPGAYGGAPQGYQGGYQQPGYGGPGQGYQSPYAASTQAYPAARAGGPSLPVIGAIVAGVIVIAAVAVVAFLALHKSNSTTASPTPAATSAPATGSFSYTDPLTSVTATVSDPRTDATGDSAHKPTSGDEFFIFDASLHNAAGVDRHYFGLDFHVSDQNGNPYTRLADGFFPASDGKYIGFGSVPAGGTQKGQLVYQIPTSTTTITVGWDDDSKIAPPKDLGTFHLK